MAFLSPGLLKGVFQVKLCYDVEYQTWVAKFLFWQLSPQASPQQI